MISRRVAAAAAIVFAALLCANVAAADTIVVDDFQNGTTQNWVNNLLGFGSSFPPPPPPPVNISTGGPAGAGDRYLQVTSTGSSGAGGRLTVINFASQWAMNYIAAGVTTISMDVNNFGATDLSLRLLFEDPTTGPPTNVAFTNAIFVPAGSGWVNITFQIGPSFLTAQTGTAVGALTNATLLRIFHSPAAAFPGPFIGAVLGIDNITATGTPTAAVPEPMTSVLVATGIGVMALRRRSRKRAG